MIDCNSTAGQKKSPERGFFLRIDVPLNRQDVNPLSLFVHASIGDDPVDLGKDRVVASHADVFSRVDARADLPYQNISRADPLAAEHLDAAPLTLAVSAVARAATCFFVCHCSYSFLYNFDNLERRLLLAVTALAAVTLAPFFLENHDLFCFALIYDFSGHFDIG